MAEGSNILPRSTVLLTDRENNSLSPALSSQEEQSAKQTEGLKESLSVTLLRKESEIRTL
jgi:sugar (pentulose or hexulose) kinase